MSRPVPELPDRDLNPLVDFLISALDRQTSTARREDYLKLALHEVLRMHHRGAIQNCLKEIQCICESQIAIFENRLAMLVVAHAELSKQCDLPDPYDILAHNVSASAR